MDLLVHGREGLTDVAVRCSRLQVSPSLPAALRRLDDLAGNFWFSWYPGTGQLFRKLDPVLWRGVGSSPRLFLRSVDQSILDSAAENPEFIREYDAVLAAFDRYLGSRPAAAGRARAGRPDRVLLRRVRLARELPHLLGWLGSVGRRSLQDGQRSRVAVRRRGPAVSAGLLQSTHRPQRPAVAGLFLDRSAQYATGAARSAPTARKSA